MKSPAGNAPSKALARQGNSHGSMLGESPGPVKLVAKMNEYARLAMIPTPE
jgi:hypothetical protein